VLSKSGLGITFKTAYCKILAVIFQIVLSRHLKIKDKIVKQFATSSFTGQMAGFERNKIISH